MDQLPPDQPSDTPEQTPPDGWQLLCTGILRSEFGRRPTRALHKAMMQLSAEQAWREGRAEARRSGWLRWLRGAFESHPGFKFAIGTVAMLLLAVVAWRFVPGIRGSHELTPFSVASCRIVDAVNVRWPRSTSLKVGDSLPTNSVHLDSGVIELAFASGAKAAVQGPADFKWIERNSFELQQGRFSAEVPKQARGFTVHTPNGAVTDLGTRFGLDVKGKASTEVDVFQGKVHAVMADEPTAVDQGWDLTRNMAMILDERGGITTAAAPEASFPQPGRAVLVRPVNCSFDAQKSVTIGGFPSAFGIWSGPAYTFTGSVGGITPAQGGGMLQFLAPQRHGNQVSDSVVWQLIDLRSAKDFISAYGVVDLKAWVQFNRTRGSAHTSSKFRLSVGAFHGNPTGAEALWATRSRTAVSYAEKDLQADNDPKTWERVEVATTVSTDADYVVVELRALAPVDASAAQDPFPGNFADLIDAKVCLPLRPGNSASAR